jgi:hypothetical protein
MNRISQITAPHNNFHVLVERLSYVRRWGFFASATLALWVAGCSHRNTVQVQLHSRAPSSQGVLNLEITAQVAGPQTGLSYKWFSVAGGCNPQKSETPSTIFKFAEGTVRDRVSVEIWREGKLIGRNDIAVRLDEVRAQLVPMEQPSETSQVEITAIPPYEPKGGPETHADIAGKVSGKISSGYSIVLYARASDVWYIQPTAYAAHAIRPDNTWTTWTHTGSSYAALLVKPGFEPIPRLDVLPSIGGYVVSKALVDGSKK